MRNLLYWLYINICCARRTAKKDLQARTFEWREPISERQREAITTLLEGDKHLQSYPTTYRGQPVKPKKTKKPGFVSAVK